MSKRARRLAAGLFPLQVELLENRLLLSAAATTTTLAASSDPILLGKIIALSATVTSTGGTPAGTVTFEDGSTLIGTVTINSTTDIATGFTNSLTLGTHNLTAIYNATSSFSGSTSATVVETVDPTSDADPADDAATTTALVASSNPIELGEVVALTATVTGASGFPTGTVSFFDGGALIGTVNINTTNQQAIGFTNTLTAGTHNITAVFDGATGFGASTSSAVSLVVNNDVITSTALVASANPIAAGQVLGLVATVTAASGTLSGTVTFNDGSTLIGAVAVNPITNQAIAFMSPLTAGTHNITATFNGGNGFVTSSSSLSVVVQSNVSSTTTLVASSNPVIEGQVVALTATVDAASGDPTGTVTFMDGASLIGTAAIDPTTQQAVAFTSSLTIGAHNITANYTGDAGYLSSTSSALSETVNPVGADTTTGLAVSPSPDLVGQTVALTATVTSLGGIPAGTVTFMDGSTLIGTVAINPATQQAIGFTDALTAGSHAITATYNGATTFASSTSSTVNEQVNPVGTLTTTALTSSSHTVVSGQTVALVATVTATSGSPAGNVSFMDGTTLLGTVAVNTSTHQAIAYSNLLSVGMHNITAVYAGNSTFATSTSAAVHEVVNIDGTATTVVAQKNNVDAASLVVFTATVTPFAPGGGAPLGTVTFMDGSTLIGTAAVDPNTNQALAGTLSLTPGIHTITAAYNGSSGYTASTSVGLSETIIGIATTTTLTVSTAATTVGQPVTFTSTVTAGSGGIPTGTVTFTDGSNTVGTATLDATGKATLSEYNLFAGTNAVTATYSGDNVHAISKSNGSTMLAITMPTLTTTSDGLQYSIATQGTGATAAQNQLVEVDYTGYLNSGVKFDSSLNPGRTPFVFALSSTEGGAIQGFVEAVVGAKVGETVVAVIPPALGYGNVANGSIPAGSTLNFIVRLIAVDLPRLTVTPAADTSAPLTPGQAASAAVGTDFGSEIVGLSTAASSFTLGSADTAQNFTLTPTSSPIIQIIGADPNDFVITQPPFIQTQDPTTGAITGGVFTIAFVPTATGVRTATIRISTNDSDFPTFTFNVTGVGT